MVIYIQLTRHDIPTQGVYTMHITYFSGHFVALEYPAMTQNLSQYPDGGQT